MKCQQVQLQHQCVLLSNGPHSQPTQVDTYLAVILVFIYVNVMYVYICFDGSEIEFFLEPLAVEDAFCNFLAQEPSELNCIIDLSCKSIENVLVG